MGEGDVTDGGVGEGDVTDDDRPPQEPGDERRHGVVRSIALTADPAQVWEALTDPDQLPAWLGAPLRWELRPGGALRVEVDGQGERSGEVDEVVPSRRLRFRWWPSDGDGRTDASTVTYELVPVPAGTRLVVTEVPLATRAASGARAMTGASGGGFSLSEWDVRLVGLWLQSRAGRFAAV